MQSTLQQMVGHRGSLEKVTGAKVVKGCGQMDCNSEQHKAMIACALKELAVQNSSRKIVDYVQSILTTQRLSLDLFERVHKLDCDLDSAAEQQRAFRQK
jgi:hypothetical protein